MSISIRQASLRQALAADDLAAVGIQGGEQAGRQGAAGAHPRSGRYVADGGDLQRLIDLGHPHRLADQLVLDLVDPSATSVRE